MFELFKPETSRSFEALSQATPLRLHLLPTYTFKPETKRQTLNPMKSDTNV
jgi:hypothetical protein